MSQKQLEEMKEETRVFLEGMGFEAAESKPGLYKKDLETVTCFWDFRKTGKGSFYATDNDSDAFLLDKDAQQLPEYVEVRKHLGGEERLPQKKKETVAPNESNSTLTPTSKPTSIAVLESKNQAYDLINQRDDSQVLLEIQGGFLEEFVYSFPTREGKVTGLSWAGVKEVARQMGNISVEDCDIRETPETWQVKCKAKDLTRNVTMFGVAEQSKKLVLKSGGDLVDMHSLSKAVSRAQRNAIRGLIPEMFIKKMIEEFSKKVN